MEIKWNNTCETWGSFCYTWSDCQLAIELDGSSGIPEILEYPKEKKKCIIKLWCKVQGYDETHQQKECNKNIKIKAEHINLILKEVLEKYMKVENVNYK